MIQTNSCRFANYQNANNYHNHFYQSLNLTLTVTMNDSHCPKCTQPFSEENPPKKLINCSHNLCYKCLKEELICPIDRLRIEKRKYTIEAFETNMELLQTIMLSKIKKDHSHTKSNIKSHASSSNNSTKCKKEFTTPIINKYSSGENRKICIPQSERVVQVQLPYLSPQKQNESRLTISPKKVRLSFDTCLLHSKKADLICLQDKCLICANCGLFGQHKLHKIIPYDQFLSQYSKVTEESYRVYQMLKEREEKLDNEAIQAKIEEVLKEKRDSQVKNIKTNISAYVDFIKRLERQLISDLDIAVAYKKNKLLQNNSIQQITAKKDQYISSIEAMSNGVDDIFNLENIGQYINYIDKESPHSFIINEGEYLLVQIDNFYRQKMQLITDETNDIGYEFTLQQQYFKETIKMHTKDFKEISNLIEENKKKVAQKRHPSGKITTPLRPQVSPFQNILSNKGQSKMSPNVKINNEEEQLLIGTSSKSGSKGSSNKVNKEISPIHPASNFDFEIGAIKPYESIVSVSTNREYDNFLKISEVTCGEPSVHRRKTLSIANQSGNSISRSKKNLDIGRENDLSRSRMAKSRNKNSQCERQIMGNILGQKSENKKKKKLDLPDKYMRVYEDLQKDKLQVLDLGGAFLGESNILAISELFTSRCRLRTVKLMNNKISDQSFPELISRCRFIQSLNLSYNLLSEKSLEWLEHEAGNLGELKNITISNNKIVLRNVRDRLEGLSKRGLKVSL